MQLSSIRSRRVALVAFLATASSITAGQSESLAGGPSHGPIYRTLDALAGGIEAVIDVATSARAATSARGRGSKCDAASCDDGCDEGLLHELQGPSHHDHMMPPALPPALPPSLPRDMPPTILTPQRDMIPLGTPTLPLPSTGPTEQEKLPAGTDDEWLDSFSPEPVRTPIRTGEKRGLPSPPPPKPPTARQPGAAGSSMPANPTGKLSPARPTPAAPKPLGPGSGQYRGPAETFDSLPDPFIDDSQSQRPTRSATRQVGYWDAW